MGLVSSSLLVLTGALNAPKRHQLETSSWITTHQWVRQQGSLKKSLFFRQRSISEGGFDNLSHLPRKSEAWWGSIFKIKFHLKAKFRHFVACGSSWAAPKAAFKPDPNFLLQSGPLPPLTRTAACCMGAKIQNHNIQNGNQPLFHFPDFARHRNGPVGSCNMRHICWRNITF